jgi:UDP-N-acetylmuramate: L-alanyl-gamma-D-glutamyl-meso-diaminopimelate ligase
VPLTDDIVSFVAKEAVDGDIVVVMSNGGFDDIHHKLLTALEARSRS